MIPDERADYFGGPVLRRADFGVSSATGDATVIPDLKDQAIVYRLLSFRGLAGFGIRREGFVGPIRNKEETTWRSVARATGT